LSPASALDAVSSAAATKTVVIILFIVNAEKAAMHEPFNLFSSMGPPQYKSVQPIFGILAAPARGGDCRLRLLTPA